MHIYRKRKRKNAGDKEAERDEEDPPPNQALREETKRRIRELFVPVDIQEAADDLVYFVLLCVI